MILDDMAAAARRRVEAAKSAASLEEIKQKALALPSGDFRFERALSKNGVSFICEVKKASPSKGVIAADYPYIDIARAYEAAGADAISVLTEPEFFLGRDAHLNAVRQSVHIPVLRKDFTVDDYQLYEAKALGADAVLLICALLDTQTIRRYIGICDTLGLSALIETHTDAEVASALEAGARVLGVNNRDLKTFSVDINSCIRLRPFVPTGVIFVAESGIKSSADIALLREAGVDAVLVGETLMRSPDKETALAELKGGAL